MRKYNMHEAKTNLSELVRRALEGEEIVLARNGTPLVHLVPVQPASGLRPIGLGAVPREDLSEDFELESLRPLSPEELALWHGPLEGNEP